MNEQQWDMVIKPKTGWFDIDLQELWRYRDLIALFVKRDFVTLYKQTILGPLWYIIQPLFTTVVFTIIFGRVAKISTDSLPPFLFYMAGNVMWGYFSGSLTATSNTFNANAGIFGKVYFPRLTVPLATVIVNFLQFFIQLLLFLGFSRSAAAAWMPGKTAPCAQSRPASPLGMWTCPHRPCASSHWNRM